MSHNEIAHLNNTTFESEVLKSSLPTVVDFWAPWCGPCRMVAPIMEQLAVDYAGQVKFTKLNTDEFPEIAANYRIASIPTLILFHAGKVLDVAIGALPKPQLKAFVDAALEQVKTSPAK